RRSVVQRDLRWYWTGAAAWGRVELLMTQGSPGPLPSVSDGLKYGVASARQRIQVCLHHHSSLVTLRPKKAFSSQCNLYCLNGSLRKRSNPPCQRVNTRRQRPATASILC